MSRHLESSERRGSRNPGPLVEAGELERAGRKPVRAGWTTLAPAWALVLGGAALAMGACDSTKTRGSQASETSAQGPGPGVEVVRRPVEGGERRTPPPAPPVEPAPAPVPALVTFAEAEAVFRSGEYGRAVELFEAYTARVPTNAWGHYMVGLSAWRADEHGKAETALLRAVEVDSTHMRAQLNLARVLLEVRRPEDALGPATRAVELDPSLVEGWRVLGNVSVELGRVDAAEVAYSNALVLDSHDAWTLNNLGLLLLQDGRYEYALYPLALATELRPDVAVFQNNLGAALERNGYVADAVDAFRAALAADDTYEKARVSLARVEPRLGTSGGVRAELSRLAAGYAEDLTRLEGQAMAEGGVRPRVGTGGPEGR